MKILRNILIIALALLLQSTFGAKFSIFGARPDIAMLVLILLVTDSGQVGSVLYGFFIGFLQDVYSPEFLGANSFTMSLMGFLLDFGKERLTVENYFVKAAVSFTVCILHDIIFLSLYTKFNSYIILNLFIKESLLGAVYTSLLLVIIVMVWEWTTRGGFGYVLQGLLGNRR